MSVPDKAVEAFLASIIAGPNPISQRFRREVTTALEAAAPFIAAEALREAAKMFDPYGDDTDRTKVRWVREFLIWQADSIERGDR